MGFKDEAREAFANLVTRVEALEELARQLKGGANVTSTRVADRTITTATNLPHRSTLDYPAVAFGLSEIKRKVSQLSNSREVASEYTGTVQYFADVFAKADPSFDVAAFKRDAGV